MSYLDESRSAVVLRHASAPTGPWSGERVLAHGSEFPGLYGAYIHPWSTETDLYFTMSQWGPYNVFLMHAPLAAPDPAPSLLSDGGFEEQRDSAVAAPSSTMQGSSLGPPGRCSP
jgi:hypothetical protein